MIRFLIDFYTLVKEAIDIALKNINRAIPVDNSNSDNCMLFVDRDFSDAIKSITRNIEYSRRSSNSKSKADFDVLFSAGAPGIGMVLI